MDSCAFTAKKTLQNKVNNYLIGTKFWGFNSGFTMI